MISPRLGREFNGWPDTKVSDIAYQTDLRSESLNVDHFAGHSRVSPASWIKVGRWKLEE